MPLEDLLYGMGTNMICMLDYVLSLSVQGSINIPPRMQGAKVTEYGVEQWRGTMVHLHIEVGEETQ